MPDDELLDRVSLLAGIEPYYWDIHGTQHHASEETKRAILRAMGYPDDRLSEVARALSEAPWHEFMPPVWVHWQRGQAPPLFRMVLPGHGNAGVVRYTITLEDGTERSGEALLDDDSLIERSSHSCRRAESHALRWDVPAEPGYHTLDCEVSLRDEVHTGRSEIIIAPPMCHRPPDHRVWGIALQIPSLVSDENFGIGDLGDLAANLELIAGAGADLIGVNPLHALFPGDGSQVSPYSPSSRLSRNILLISIRSLPEWDEFGGVRLVEQNGELSELFAAARGGELIPFEKVYELKLGLLERLFSHFETEHVKAETERGRAFLEWERRAPAGFRDDARYCTVREVLRAEDPNRWGWPVWPEAFRDPVGEASKVLCEERRSRVQFYLWLQWLVDQQLAALSDRARELGMSLGLYLDLAVGANGGGAETWSNQRAYVFSAGMGAPPDELGPKGQGWGLPPFHPDVLRRAAYRPFRDTLRAAMSHAGALRIDHVMSLFRLFWIPLGLTPKEGGYVRYPFDDLLAIITLESTRSKCIVIGEDLGTVPDEVRNGMAQAGVLSYKVVYFMIDQDGATPPRCYPRDSIVVTSTHDLAPFVSYWSGADITLRERLGLFDTLEIGKRTIELRQAAREHLIRALHTEGLWSGEVPLGDASPELSCALHRFLARSASVIQMVQVEDILCLSSQVNVPGTVSEHPNWQRRLPVSLREALGSEYCARLLTGIRSERGRSHPGSG